MILIKSWPNAFLTALFFKEKTLDILSIFRSLNILMILILFITEVLIAICWTIWSNGIVAITSNRNIFLA